MRPHTRASRGGGFTVIELLTVVAVISVLLAIAVPSMHELTVRQRMKSASAEFVTDMQYARSLAVSQNTLVRVKFMQSAQMSCYVIYVQATSGNCDCTLTPGSVCSGSKKEIRTTQFPADTDVQIQNQTSGNLGFVADGLPNASQDYVVLTSRISGAPGRIQVTVGPTGRPTICTPDQSMPGFATC